jgi:hypothetical protein
VAAVRGGTLLFQCAGAAVVGGTISVLGGYGGELDLPSQDIRIKGGNGADGFCRFETPTALPLAALSGLWPAPRAESAGTLTEEDLVTTARSTVYDVGNLFPDYTHYRLTVRVGQNTAVFSDDPALGTMPVVGITPVAIWFQGVILDQDRQPLSYLPWDSTPGGMAPVRTVLPQGFRFTIQLDRGLLPPGTRLEVVKLEVFHR